ncbi:MAG TPA: hypothetical protein VLN73_03320, partial [Alphaproteobacteria bacterium]|nr:hypothetical protein [Alphaproteobacteria bacterium]
KGREPKPLPGRRTWGGFWSRIFGGDKNQPQKAGQGGGRPTARPGSSRGSIFQPDESLPDYPE